MDATGMDTNVRTLLARAQGRGERTVVRQKGRRMTTSNHYTSHQQNLDSGQTIL